MKNHLKWTIVFLLLGIIAYLFSPSIKRLLAADSYLSARIALMYLSGSLGIILMSAAVLISARFSFINNLFGGLDKAYEVHKSTAALGFAFGLIHFLMSFSNRLMIKFNVIPEPAHSTNPLTGAVLSFYKAGYAYLEPAFILLIIIVCIAVIKKVPYHIFKYTHKIIPILYLQIALHAFTVPFRGGWVDTIGGYILQGMIIFGVIGAIFSLFNLTGIKHRYKGMLLLKEKISNDIIHIKVKFHNNTNFNFFPGQFVFLKFAYSLEPHPFSVAGYNKDTAELEFFIKECGDFTSNMYNKLQENSNVLVEGPYGQFTFNDNKNNQIWVAGGIGITPFLAKLSSLKDNKASSNIDFIYSKIGDSPFDEKLKVLCEKAGVNLHLVDSKKDGLLTYDKIKTITPNITSASIWFCGPLGFRKSIYNGLKADNINTSLFHFDNFSFR